MVLVIKSRLPRLPALVFSIFSQAPAVAGACLTNFSQAPAVAGACLFAFFAGSRGCRCLFVQFFAGSRGCQCLLVRFVVDTPLLSRFARISPAFVDAAAAHSSAVTHRLFLSSTLSLMVPIFFTWTPSSGPHFALRTDSMFWFPSAPVVPRPFGPSLILASACFSTFLPCFVSIW